MLVSVVVITSITIERIAIATSSSTRVKPRSPRSRRSAQRNRGIV
jgi:hypothetical protein